MNDRSEHTFTEGTSRLSLQCGTVGTTQIAGTQSTVSQFPFLFPPLDPLSAHQFFSILFPFRLPTVGSALTDLDPPLYLILFCEKQHGGL